MKLTDDQKKQICEMAEKGMSTLKICESLGLNKSYVYQVIKKDPFFAEQLKEARNSYTEDLIEMIPTLADTMLSVPRAKLKIQSIRDYAEITNPEKYGRKLDVRVEAHINLDHVLKDATARILPFMRDVQPLDTKDKKQIESPDDVSEDEFDELL